MVERFLFFSDTGQQQFEAALETAGALFWRGAAIGEVFVDAVDDWRELARDCGAECS